MLMYGRYFFLSPLEYVTQKPLFLQSLSEEFFSGCLFIPTKNRVKIHRAYVNYHSSSKNCRIIQATQNSYRSGPNSTD